MSRKAAPIKPLQLRAKIEKLRTKPNGGKIAVGGDGCDGLYLRVTGNTAHWLFLYAKGTRVDGKGQTVTRLVSVALFDQKSGYPEVSLETARKRARELRENIRAGIDPQELRQAARIEREKARTFQQCAIDYIEGKRAGWKSKRHADQWKNSLETYAFPIIGKMSIAAVDTAAVLRVLRQGVTKDGGIAPLWNAKNETANRVRCRIEAILSWAEFLKYRPEGKNPAIWKGGLVNVLPAPLKVQNVKHYDSLPHTRIAEFMAVLRKLHGLPARALEFSILTAARSGEVRGAKWGEVDLTAKTWTIPADRMKAGKEHQIPLSSSAIALLQALPRFESNGPDYVFPAPRGGGLTAIAIFRLLRLMNFGQITQHGFRSTFREWAGEVSSHSRDVIEHALAHQLKDKSEAAYQRGTLWPKRIKLMADWASYCEPVTANNVIRIKKSEAR